MAKKKQITLDFSSVEKRLLRMVEPLAEALGLELIDVEYVKEAGNWYLRFYIDREPPVDHDCCQALSEKISDLLDKEDPIAESYFLEVSSPGLNRPLKREADFTRFSGREVEIKLYAPWEGAKEYRGLLRGLDAGSIIIERDGKQLSIPLEQVARTRLALV